MIKINFKGGIISPGDLYNILIAAGKAGIVQVRFGLRQQLLLDTDEEGESLLGKELDTLGISYEINSDEYPNVVSSYPAEEVFITNTWLSEGVYKDIFDLMDHRPRLKINVSDSNQSFTPLLTGNINWVASPSAQHFWHLFIRFPKTNVIYEWKDMVYTNDVARMSKQIESLIIKNPAIVNGELLYEMIQQGTYITRPVEQPLKLPTFNLPYYEGLNRYNNKYWLGIYRRDELFTISFLKEVCLLCLQTKVGQLCSSPWKSIIIKGIEEKDKLHWTNLLARHQVNVRHAANELNFQVEDNCHDGLALKKYLVNYLSKDDIRTFGVCIGIKTRTKTEVFSSILVRRRPLFKIGKFEFLFLYDILCAKDFNPNERTGFVFSKGNPKAILKEQLRRAVISFNTYQSKQVEVPKEKKSQPRQEKKEYVYQCKHCMTIADEAIGEPGDDYICQLCEAPKEDLMKIEKSAITTHSALHAH